MFEFAESGRRESAGGEGCVRVRWLLVAQSVLEFGSSLREALDAITE
jgi:hypothetical protein